MYFIYLNQSCFLNILYKKQAINKKGRFLDTGIRGVLKINVPYIFYSCLRLTLDYIFFICKSMIIRLKKEETVQ